MHELRVAGCRSRHDPGGHLVRPEQRDALVPGGFGLAHRDPHVRVDDVRSVHGLVQVLRDQDPGAAVLRDELGRFEEVLTGPDRRRRPNPQVHAHGGRADKQLVAHVPARVPHVRQRDLPKRLVDVLADREQVGEHLGRVVLVRQPVVDRDAGEPGKRLHVSLVEAPELDGVVHAAEHPRGVLHGLLLADMAARRSEVRHVGALIVRSHLEPDPGPGAVLLEDERDRLAGKAPNLTTLALLDLEACGEAEERLDLGSGEVTEGEEGSTTQVDRRAEGHRRFSRVAQQPRMPGRAVPASGPDLPRMCARAAGGARVDSARPGRAGRAADGMGWVGGRRHGSGWDSARGRRPVRRSHARCRGASAAIPAGSAPE
jgi:hypothetical protein